MANSPPIRTAPLPVCGLDDLGLLRNRIAMFASAPRHIRLRLVENARRTVETFRRMESPMAKRRVTFKPTTPAVPTDAELARSLRTIAYRTGSLATALRSAGVSYLVGAAWVLRGKALPAEFRERARAWIDLNTTPRTTP